MVKIARLIVDRGLRQHLANGDGLYDGIEDSKVGAFFVRNTVIRVLGCREA
jgi:hypothetical protein